MPFAVVSLHMDFSGCVNISIFKAYLHETLIITCARAIYTFRVSFCDVDYSTYGWDTCSMYEKSFPIYFFSRNNWTADRESDVNENENELETMKRSFEYQSAWIEYIFAYIIIVIMKTVALMVDFRPPPLTVAHTHVREPEHAWLNTHIRLTRTPLIQQKQTLNAVFRSHLNNLDPKSHTRHTFSGPQWYRRATLICFCRCVASFFKWHFMSSSVLILLIMLLSQAFLYHQPNTHDEYKSFG